MAEQVPELGVGLCEPGEVWGVGREGARLGLVQHCEREPIAQGSLTNACDEHPAAASVQEDEDMRGLGLDEEAPQGEACDAGAVG